jgi:hypothetical protein
MKEEYIKRSGGRQKKNHRHQFSEESQKEALR